MDIERKIQSLLRAQGVIVTPWVVQLHVTCDFIVECLGSWLITFDNSSSVLRFACRIFNSSFWNLIINIRQLLAIVFIAFHVSGLYIN